MVIPTPNHQKSNPRSPDKPIQRLTLQNNLASSQAGQINDDFSQPGAWLSILISEYKTIEVLHSFTHFSSVSAMLLTSNVTFQAFIKEDVHGKNIFWTSNTRSNQDDRKDHTKETSNNLKKQDRELC